MSNNTILIITDSKCFPLGNLKEKIDQLEKLGYKINKKKQVVSILGITFSFRRTENCIQVVAHSHCKEPNGRNETYYFIYNYDRPDVDILTVLNDFVLKAKEEIKKNDMEISDEKGSFFLFESLKKVITNNRIPQNENRLIEAAFKCFNEKKPVQLKAWGIKKSVYFLVELCSRYKELNYKELNYIIYHIDNPKSEPTGAIRVYINQNTGDDIKPTKQFEKWIKREKQRETDLLKKAQDAQREKKRQVGLSEEVARIPREIEPAAHKEPERTSYNKFFAVVLVLGVLLLGYWALAPGENNAPENVKSTPITTPKITATTIPVHNVNKGTNYLTIQSAINDASSGDEIRVDSGTYYENVNVSKQLILRGVDNGGGKPILDGGTNGDAIRLEANALVIG